MNLRDPNVRRLAELARAQGWRIQENGTKLGWFPPDTSQKPVFTRKAVDESGNDLANVVAFLRRAGLKLRPEDVQSAPEPPPAEPPEPAMERFTRDLIGLIEDELERRTQNLHDQVEALRNDNANLRQRLAEAEHGVEERARQAASRAVEELLAARRLPR